MYFAPPRGAQIVEEPIRRVKRRMGSFRNMQDRKISNVK